MIDILTYILAFTVPFAVMQACRHSRILDAIGAIIILYALGLVAGFLGLKSDAQTVISGITIPIAIPLILFGNDLSQSLKNTKDTVLAFFSCLVSAILAIAISYYIFRPGADIAGMIAGCVTGGTMNMASVKLAIGADDATFVLLNTYDMAVSFVYMLVLLVFGIRLSRKFLPVKTLQDSPAISKTEEPAKKATAKDYAKATAKDYAIDFLFAAGCCLASLGIAKLFNESIFMLVFILFLTAAGIALSYVKKIRTRPGTYDLGMYFVYVFSFVVASMADFKGMSIGANAKVLGFYASVIFMSLFLHLIFSWILRIDADTAVIASNAFINAPPSVPVISSAMKNQKALTSGLTIGIVGYAIGTYLGIFVTKIIESLI